MDIAALKRDLDGIKVDDHPAIVQQKSRDFYWYSPVLKAQLDHVKGDLIVTPKNEGEVLRVLAACHKHGVPVTPRGSGTGNYGQAMPLSGGVVLNLAEMNEIKVVAPGRVVTGPGAVLAEIDKATRAHSGQELRLSPSTYNTASIGGFIAGGSGGVGTIPSAPIPGAVAKLAADKRTAIPPASAPEAVKQAIYAANRITNKPYRGLGSRAQQRAGMLLTLAGPLTVAMGVLLLLGRF